MIDLNILKQKTKSEGLEYIYKEIGDYILLKGIPADRKYKEIDKLILNFLNENFNFHFYVGVLTATVRFKHKLRNRKQLWDKTIERAEEENVLSNNEQLKNTLNNLE